jgi:hypothetical protein
MQERVLEGRRMFGRIGKKGCGIKDTNGDGEQSSVAGHEKGSELVSSE